MQIFVILALLILIFAVIFALQNPVTAIVTFLFWKFEGSLALVLLVALGAGLVISFLAYLPNLLRGNWSGRKLRKQVAELEINLADHKQRLEETLLKLQSQSTPSNPPETAEPPPDQTVTTK